MNIAFLAGYSPSLPRLRGPLLRAMLAAGHRVTALAPDDDPRARHELARMGVDFQPIPLRRAGLNPLADLGTLAALRRALRLLSPDLVLSSSAKAVIWGSLAARQAGVPRIYALITGLGRAFFLERERPGLGRRALNLAARALFRRSLPACHGLLFQNQDDRDLFLRLGLLRPGQAALVTAGSGVDLEHFAPAEPVLPDAVEGGPVFLTLTRMLLAKGLPEFVEAARTLKAQYPAAEFRACGPLETGPGAVPRARLAAWAREGAVTFVPAVDDVRPELRRASVVVLASAYREGLPHSLLEAMAMARPVITTDVPGCCETVVPGRNGFLVPPRDPGALARAMEQFILNPGRIPDMGAASRTLAEERFDVRSVNAQILAFLGLA